MDIEKAFIVYSISTAAAAAKLLQSCLTLCNPIDGSPPGSPVPRILKARTLEWVAISFFSFVAHICKTVELFMQLKGTFLAYVDTCMLQWRHSIKFFIFTIEAESTLSSWKY